MNISSKYSIIFVVWRGSVEKKKKSSVLVIRDYKSIDQVSLLGREHERLIRYTHQISKFIHG